MKAPVLLALGLLAACSADAPVAPRPMETAATSAPQTLQPASAYRMKVLFPGVSGPSVIYDVTEKGTMVGSVDNDAFAYDLHGAVTLLPRGGYNLARAKAVAAGDYIAGEVFVMGRWYPAFWANRYSAPIQLSGPGTANDTNDRGEVVGVSDHDPFYWETRTGTVVTLPVPTGASYAEATSINNDRVVVGISDIGGVLWRQGPGGWTATRLRGILPLAIDHGYAVVGYNTSGDAVWGKPSYASTIATSGEARGISANHLVAGLVGYDPFVADLGGGLTVLPMGLSHFGFASAVNSCGLVVGATTGFSFAAATYWDPGC